MQELFNIGIFAETFKSWADEPEPNSFFRMQRNPLGKVLRGAESRSAQRGSVEDDGSAIMQPARLPCQLRASSVAGDGQGAGDTAKEGRRIADLVARAIPEPLCRDGSEAMERVESLEEQRIPHQVYEEPARFRVRGIAGPCCAKVSRELLFDPCPGSEA